MRNRLIFISLVTFLLSSLASCEKAGQDDFIDVSFTVKVPSSVATKAISDGSMANIVYWAAFDASGNPVSGMNGSTALNSNRSAVITESLVKHVYYNFVFWAHCGDASGKNAAYDLSAFNSEGKVTVNYKGDANDESRDAFYAHTPITIDDTPGSGRKTVPLYRPFAQINFLAKDYKVVEEAGVNASLTSKIEVTGLPTVLDGKDGTVSGSASTALNFKAIPTGTDAYFTIGNVRYGWYSMNYVLAAAGNNDNVTIVGKFKHDKSAKEISLTVNSVPYERNHRTNIIGNFFTEQAVLTIKVDPNFVDADNDGKPDDINDGYTIQ